MRIAVIVPALVVFALTGIGCSASHHASTPVPAGGSGVGERGAGQNRIDHTYRATDASGVIALQWGEWRGQLSGVIQLHTFPGGDGRGLWLAQAQDGLTFRGIPGGPMSREDEADMRWNRSGRISADSRVRGHRSDQTVAGVLAHRLGMHLTYEGLIACRHGTNPPSVILVNDRALRLEPKARELVPRIIRRLRPRTAR
jgi:hypothetical protein